MKIMLPALAICTLFSFPVAAEAQLLSLCDGESASMRRGGWVLDVSYKQSQSAQQNNLKQMSLAVIHYAEARAPRGAGMAHITDGTSNTILAGEGPVRLSCTDVDNDGVAGIGLIELEMREAGSGEITVVRVIPLDGEIDEDGDEPVLIIVGATTATGRAVMIISAGPNRFASGA
jgi:hypothetical protein